MEFIHNYSTPDYSKPPGCLTDADLLYLMNVQPQTGDFSSQRDDNLKLQTASHGRDPVSSLSSAEFSFQSSSDHLLQPEDGQVINGDANKRISTSAEVPLSPPEPILDTFQEAELDFSIPKSSPSEVLEQQERERTVHEGLFFAHALEADTHNAQNELINIDCSPESRKFLIDYLEKAINDTESYRILTAIFPREINAVDLASDQDLRATVSELRRLNSLSEQVVSEIAKLNPDNIVELRADNSVSDSASELPRTKEAVREYCCAEIICLYAQAIARDGRLPNFKELRAYIEQRHVKLVNGRILKRVGDKGPTDAKLFNDNLSRYKDNGQNYLEQFERLNNEHADMRKIIYRSPSRRKFINDHQLRMVDVKKEQVNAGN